jgi:hypothetical protein
MKKSPKIVSSFARSQTQVTILTYFGTSKLKATMCHQFETFIGGTCSSSSRRKAREMTNVVCAMFNAFSLFPSKMILWCEVHV